MTRRRGVRHSFVSARHACAPVLVASRRDAFLYLLAADLASRGRSNSGHHRGWCFLFSAAGAGGVIAVVAGLGVWGIGEAAELVGSPWASDRLRCRRSPSTRSRWSGSDHEDNAPQFENRPGDCRARDRLERRRIGGAHGHRGRWDLRLHVRRDVRLPGFPSLAGPDPLPRSVAQKTGSPLRDRSPTDRTKPYRSANGPSTATESSEGVVNEKGEADIASPRSYGLGWVTAAVARPAAGSDPPRLCPSPPR